MMVRHLIVVAFLVLAAPPHTSGQEIGVESSRKSLRQHSWYFNYPGGMLFHTAFNHTLTTRYILLKETKQCSSLEQYLELDANQMDVIKKLRPLRVEKPPGTGATDPNAQPDEHVLDSNYLSFLRPEQLDRLDLVAFRFDGYAAITRASMAARVDLSDESKAKVEAKIAHLRDTIFLPRFRQEFAARLPHDIKYRDCQFAGAFVTHVNCEIVELLTEAECSRIHQLIVSKIDPNVIRELEEIATLPGGVHSLGKHLTESEFEQFNDDKSP